jgi:peptidoglycan-associated lipoprotein
MVRSVGMVSVIALLVVALSGCGCFYQTVKGEKAAPAAPAAAVQKAPEAPVKAAPVEQKSAAPAAPAPVVTLEDIRFDFDRYAVRPADVEILKKNYAWFQKNPGTKVKIEGNCDERGTVEYNLALGQKRADSAKNYLISLGVEAGLLETISYGKERPVDPGHNEEAWAKNRRDHFVSLKK